MQATRSPGFYFFSKCIRAHSVLSHGSNFRFSNNSTFTRPYTNCIRSLAHPNKPTNFLVTKPITLIAFQCKPTNSFKLFVRNSSTDSKEFCGQRTLERYYRRDGLPRSYELIYRSDFPQYLLLTQGGVFVALAALIVAGITFMLITPKTEAEQAIRKEAMLKEFEDKKQKDRESSIGKAVANIRVEKGWDDPSAKGPQIEDLIEGGPAVYVTLIFLVAFFAASLFRVQQMMPVRIYMNNKKHGVAVYYGHIIPGMLTHQEFVAGTVRPFKGSWPGADSGTLFRDGSGKKLILFERFFRHPGDYNKVMGYDEEFMQEVVQERLRQPRITSRNRTDDDKDKE